MARTYFYKMTSDRGGAPCAVAPRGGDRALLSLAICKPAIRRTAQAGDRIFGITSHSLAASDGYPLGSVIYAAVVKEGIDAREYCEPGTEFAGRPDCIYEFHQQNGRASHDGRSRLHRGEAHLVKDLGRYPFYKNGRVLLCEDFRYFGAGAVKIPARLHLLNAMADALGQGHRVFEDGEPEVREADALMKVLWKKTGGFTAEVAGVDAYEGRGKRKRRQGHDL